MPLSDEAQDQIIDRLRAKRSEPDNCPICGSDTFSVADLLFNTPMAEGIVQTVAMPMYATHILVTCTNCGLTHMINANVLGIMDILLEDGVARGLIPPPMEATIRADLELRAARLEEAESEAG
jgi:predicted nucleic-acid-binding Zn-ribbon protein